jgi:hypothetical protein
LNGANFLISILKSNRNESFNGKMHRKGMLAFLLSLKGQGKQFSGSTSVYHFTPVDRKIWFNYCDVFL